MTTNGDPAPPAAQPASPPPRKRRVIALAAVVAAAVAIGVVALVPGSSDDNPDATARTFPTQAPSAPVRGHARTYYVAPWGRDGYRATNPRYPWRTVARVNRARLRPGDRVLFKAGETFADSVLMPGRGDLVSGLPHDPITFGSWGRGRATLPNGIFLGHSPAFPNGPSHLAFTNLALGPGNGVQAYGDYISLTRLRITGIVHASHLNQTGIRTEGSHWLIAGNRIDRTGDSGMLLGFNASEPGVPAGGADYIVRNNVIDHTGLDPTLKGTHGIYLKVSHALIAHNRILNFHDDGVSVRYRDAHVVDNVISHGSIGIAWFQYDRTAGTSEFVGNSIADTQRAAIFVCGAADACRQPLETFVIRRNRMRRIHGVQLNLMKTSGDYRVAGNG